MNSLLKIAVSTLVMSAALVGNSAGYAGSSAPTAAARADRHAVKIAAKASKALKARDGTKAVALAENAVALSPENVEHRALLGQAYLLAGRFASASTAFRDVLTLSPAHGRAALSLALSEIAQGRNQAARDALAQAHRLVPDADYGLALALAGDRDSAIAVLEAAARTEGATAKTRQNLALAFAMAGRWKEAHVVAAQDVPADQLPARMAEWARFARPSAASDQVASLLGVKPVADAGLPAQLALAPVAPVAIAAVAPETIVPLAPPAPAVDTVPDMAEAEARAAESIFHAAPVAAPAPVMHRVDLPASQPVMRVAAFQPKVGPRAHPARQGGFVVQLGAFSSAGRAEAAWSIFSARSRRLGGYEPSSMKFVSPAQATLYRLSVGGFATRAEASELCRQVKAGGGECFVRGVAGDVPMRWASRANDTRLASR